MDDMFNKLYVLVMKSLAVMNIFDIFIHQTDCCSIFIPKKGRMCRWKFLKSKVHLKLSKNSMSLKL